MRREPWVSGGADNPDPAARERVVMTPDGRTLGVAEYGPAGGAPVFFLHGTPGCRYVPPPPEDLNLFDRLGVRVIEYDRPGYGLSTRQPGRRVSDATSDIAVVADALAIGRFAVLGASGGGPHCLAASAILHDRVLRAACMVGVAPIGEGGLPRDEWLADMTVGNVREVEWTLAGEDVLRPQLERLAAEELSRAANDPAHLLGDEYELSEGDRALMADPRRAERLRRGTQEAYRTGVDGWVDDNLAVLRPWGFDLDLITAPLTLWFGRSDTFVPAAHGEWLAQRLPHARVVRMPGGHLDGVHRLAEVFGWLVNGEVPTDAV